MMIVNEVESYHDNEQQQQLEQVVAALIVGRLHNNMRTHLILENDTPNSEASCTTATRRCYNPVSSCGTGSTGGGSSANDSCSDRVEEQYYYENEIIIVQANDKDYDDDDDSHQEGKEETSRTKCCLLEFEMEDDDEEEEEVWDNNTDNQPREDPYNKYRHYPQLQSKVISQRQQQQDCRNSPTSTMSSSVFEFGDTDLSKTYNHTLFVPSSSVSVAPLPLFSNERRRHVTFGAILQKQVYSIPPNSEYTEAERTQLWYTQEEMQAMRLQRRRERRSFLL